MKKVLVVCMLVALVAAMSVNVFAANGFVSSPSGRPAPGVVEFTPVGGGSSEGTLIITPYGDKEKLPAEMQAIMEEAYNQIVNADDLTVLNADLEKLAKDLGISVDKLAISDLVHLHVENGTSEDGQKGFNITLSAEILEHFVGLLYMNEDGTWELIEDAKVLENGAHLQFSVEQLSTIAVVVDATYDIPQTGDDTMLVLYGVLMAVSVVALIFVVIKSRKQKA